MTSPPIKVLVVDDIAANLVALEAVLAPLGVDIVRATSGTGAVAMVEAHMFAVAILDVMMPEMDGFETARCIRQQDRGRTLPIILLTAYEFALPQIRAAYASGVADFIFKPFDPDILRSKVAVFVELYRKNRIERERDEARARRRAQAHRSHQGRVPGDAVARAAQSAGIAAVRHRDPDRARARRRGGACPTARHDPATGRASVRAGRRLTGDLALHPGQDPRAAGGDRSAGGRHRRARARPGGDRSPGNAALGVGSVRAGARSRGIASGWCR